MYVCMYVCMHACMYVCMYVDIYIYMCVYIYIYTYRTCEVPNPENGDPRTLGVGFRVFRAFRSRV